MTVEDVAMGFIRVANEAMCRPIRALTQVQFHSLLAMHPFGVINKTYSEQYFNNDSLQAHITFGIGFMLQPCKIVVCFLLGNSPASEFYMPTFRNTLYVPSS